ncbi:META domain-containing protein [Flavobacteriaceae bacterium XHP0103]|uniref:META domain-containing protein n=1 Tax=Marixanthotalea marina TaxID=2844359 RepID=UPI002989BE33|nr:META domain-containing protein [Marixanthotalea marina]MBU3820849.1 META domain-containing protein [Marixanthotalea marina]
MTKSSMQENENNLANLTGLFNVEILNGNNVISNKQTLNFDTENHKIFGFSGCNRFTGSYTLNENEIKIGPLASTKRLCVDDNANQIETKFLEALSTADNISFKKNKLTLFSGEKSVLTANKQEVSDSIAFNYSAISRGTFLKININDSTVIVVKSRKDKPISKPLSEESKEKLKALLNTINLDSLSQFKDPTQARFYDGASIGTLEISKNGNTYESTNFDHGTPPKEIEALVKEILSISENVE